MTILNYVSIKNLKTKAQTHYQQANNLSRGTLGVIIYALKSFNDAAAAETAASIAYYALFSLFPLLIFLVTVASSVLESKEVVQEVINFTATALPPAKELVEQNIQEILARRGTMSFIAAVGLLWAATNVFVILTRHINKAWHTAKPRNYFERRLFGLIIVIILAALLILSLLSTTVFKLLPWLDIQAPLWGEVSLYDTYSWAIASHVIPWFFIFVMCVALYRWIPNTKVGWTEAIIGASVAATAGEITKFCFTWYVSSGFARYDLIYGSLGTLVILMLSIYLGSLILLFGAHLSAAISYYRQQKNKGD